MISDAVAGPADSLMTSASDPIPDAETSDDQEDEAIEESRRAEELRKLRVMSAESLRRISELDMVGEFGSKVCRMPSIGRDTILTESPDQYSHQTSAALQATPA